MDSHQWDYVGEILRGDEMSCAGFTQNGGQAISSERKGKKSHLV